jgi:uncharacterized membrane protein SpoIIM required for sporulation/ABC-type transport system involved in multi-copper enzyme maturation permease subunit
MRTKIFPVWLIAQRELRDQLRDWRVLFPLIVIVFLFPFLMNAVAEQAVAFVGRFGGTLLVDRLVPFSVLIIGFFPLTVSLVGSLETFVGEKERGTIEPLLSSPLEDWQLYVGKLLAGVVSPLVASYLSITFYLLMVSQQQITMPAPRTLVLLYVLTAVHAVLMVSAAIVVSVQSTSVRAANLLASFIVIPTAMMMQGESVLLFWGNDETLWLAIVAVFVMASLLVRLGIAHFEREYLLGREIDTFSARRAWRIFWGTFKGEARSLPQWYAQLVFPALHRLKSAFLLILLLAAIGFWAGYDWVSVNGKNYIQNIPPEKIATLTERFNSANPLGLPEVISAPYLFMHNIRAVTVIMFFGLLSFSVLGLMFYLVNIGVVGAVLGALGLVGISPLLVFLTGILPHGIFELPALMLSSAAMLRIGVELVTPQRGKSIGQVFLELLADWAKIFIGIVIPLLAIAAVVEAYITPVLLHTVVMK